MSWVSSTVKAGIKYNAIPSLEFFDTDDYQDFAIRNGYQYMYTFVEFIVAEYGYDKLYELIKAPDDFVGVFGLTQDELWDEWVGFLNQNYE